MQLVGNSALKDSTRECAVGPLIVSVGQACLLVRSKDTGSSASLQGSSWLVQLDEKW